MIRLALALLLLAPLAHATIIHVDYDGVISSVDGSGFGFNVGDPISGRLLINTVHAGDSHYIKGGQISGTENAVPMDHVGITKYTAISEFGIPAFYDFGISNGSMNACSNPQCRGDVTSIFQQTWGFIFEDNGTLNGTGLNQAFSVQNIGSGAIGRIFGDTWEGAHYALNSFTYRAVAIAAVAVAEPASWVLMVGGLGALVLVRRRKRA